MSEQVMALVEKSSLKTEVPQFEIGDTVDVHCRILEGEKERIQIFNGVVIARAGSRHARDVHRPPHRAGRRRRAEVPPPLATIAKIEVKRSGVTRRAKLYYLRDRTGKAVRLKERRTNVEK